MGSTTMNTVTLHNVASDAPTADKQVALDEVQRLLKALGQFSRTQADESLPPVTMTLNGKTRTIDGCVMLVHSAGTSEKAVAVYAVGLHPMHMSEYGPAIDQFVQQLTDGALEVWPFPRKLRTLVKAFRDKIIETFGVDVAAIPDADSIAAATARKH
jgi:hypothetical protein